MAISISRKLIIAEAERRNWQVESFGFNNYFYRITDQNGNSVIFRGTRPQYSSANGARISVRKDLTLEFIQYLGYKVPAYITVSEMRHEAESFLDKHELVVVKPADSEQSIGVTTDIKSNTQLQDGISKALVSSRSGKIIIQTQLHGNLYRLFIINGKLVAAAHRRAAQVIGDGHSSVGKLIELVNADPRRGDSSDTPLKKIKIDDCLKYLGGDRLRAVPSKGEIIRVSVIDSVSAGGESINVTGSVHNDWGRIAGDIAKQAGLFVCGVDIICDNIAKPVVDNFIPLLEINSEPGLKLHHYPTGGGEIIDVAAILLDEVFVLAKNR